jgi:PAS domain S-box-containing protein
MKRQTPSHNTFRHVFDQSPIGQMLYGQDGKILHVNPALNTLLGYADRALQSLHIQDIVLPLNSNRPDVMGLGIHDAGGYLQLDRLCRCENGDLLEVKLTLYAVHDAKGEFLYHAASIESIHDLKQRESQIQTFSHDVKSPLTNILSAVGLLAEELPRKKAKSLQELLSYIQTSTRHALEIADTLHRLSFVAQGVALNKQQGTVNQLMQDALNDCVMMAREKSITLDYAPLEPDVSLLMDGVLMRQALDNLLTNAIKYTAKGGWVRVSTLLTADEVIIQVRDNGLGIPQEDVDNVFRRFYRVETAEHLAVDGTGLGLSIIKAIVEQHDGRIWVESELGVGSTFYIALPLED